MLVEGVMIGLVAGFALGSFKPRSTETTASRDTQQQRDALLGPPPAGYGDVIPACGGARPSWLSADEIVARHLPMGLSERKAGMVIAWDHPFRIRADHPHYK